MLIWNERLGNREHVIVFESTEVDFSKADAFKFDPEDETSWG